MRFDRLKSVASIAADRHVMGDARSGWLSRTVLLLTFAGMAGSVVGLAASYLRA